MRLPPEARAMVEVVTVAAVFDDPGALDRLLEGVLAASPGGGRRPPNPASAAPEAPDRGG